MSAGCRNPCEDLERLKNCANCKDQHNGDVDASCVECDGKSKWRPYWEGEE